MEECPAELLRLLPDEAGPIVKEWWTALSQADRQRIAKLWDEKVEVRFFSPMENASGSVDAWEDVPSVVGGRFVPHDDNGLNEWGPGYFEHLLQHPELVMAYDPPLKIFHIGCIQPR
ncbi:MAG TPA: hypothetical protein VHD36_02240 [Pirellulales bacterium]|nr:hypothetical protein [Pirellulales bacterium]